MRIDSNGPIANGLDAEQTTKAAGEGRRTQVSASQDKATLSSDPQRVRSLESKAMNLPEVRQEKVQALQQAIRDGKYRIEADEMAEAMLRHMGK